MTRDIGGEHRFELGQEVKWQGVPATVVALTIEPSATIELTTGSRLTVGQSALQATGDSGGDE